MFKRNFNYRFIANILKFILQMLHHNFLICIYLYSASIFYSFFLHPHTEQGVDLVIWKINLWVVIHLFFFYFINRNSNFFQLILIWLTLKNKFGNYFLVAKFFVKFWKIQFSLYIWENIQIKKNSFGADDFLNMGIICSKMQYY